MNTFAITAFAFLAAFAVLTEASGTNCPHGCPVSRCGSYFPGNTPYSCPNGYVKDACGCEKQDCQCFGCPPTDYTRFCRDGYRTQGGCPNAYFCVTNGVEIQYRCPNLNEPANNPSSYTCTQDSQCGPAGRNCCKVYGKIGMRCVDGIAISAH